ncbi:hypothetical protein ACRRTK_008409 [Alexandromys fortis]
MGAWPHGGGTVTRFDARSRKRCQYWGAGGGRRAASGEDLLFYAEWERGVLSAQAEAANTGGESRSAREECVSTRSRRARPRARPG